MNQFSDMTNELLEMHFSTHSKLTLIFDAKINMGPPQAMEKLSRK